MNANTHTYVVTPAASRLNLAPVTIRGARNVEEARRKARQLIERRYLRDISEALMADIARAFADAVVVREQQRSEAA